MPSNNGNNKTAGQVAAVQAFNNYLAFNLGATPVDRHNAELVNSRILAFFNYCVDTDIPANVVALSLALGINKTTMYNWINGNVKDLAPEVVNSIKKAVNIIESNTLSNAQNGSINTIAAALVLNNNFGYANNNTTVNIEVKPQQSIDQLQNKYAGLLPECPPDAENDE